MSFWSFQVFQCLVWPIRTPKFPENRQFELLALQLYIFSEKGWTTAWLLSNIIFFPIITLGFCKKMHIVLSHQFNADQSLIGYKIRCFPYGSTLPPSTPSLRAFSYACFSLWNVRMQFFLLDLYFLISLYTYSYFAKTAWKNINLTKMRTSVHHTKIYHSVADPRGRPRHAPSPPPRTKIFLI